MESPFRGEHKHRPKPRDKCCFCIPIRVGVLVVLTSYLLGSASALGFSIWLFREILWLVAVSGVVHSLLILGFLVGLVGVFKRSSRIYLSGPVTSVIYFFWGMAWVVLLSLAIHRASKNELDGFFSRFGNANDFRRVQASFSIAIANTIITIYYIYILFKFYKILKHNEFSG